MNGIYNNVWRERLPFFKSFIIIGIRYKTNMIKEFFCSLVQIYNTNLIINYDESFKRAY